MAYSNIFLVSHILSLILFHFLLLTEPTTSSVQIPTETKQVTGFRASLTLRNSGKTWPKYASTNQLKDDPSASLINTEVQCNNDVYTMSLAIGTPPVTINSAIMDTGSNLIWTKCKTSSGVYDTNKSTSFSNVTKSCDEVGLGQYCIQNYDGGNVSVSVTLGQETLTMGNKKIKDVIFGCGIPNKKNFSFDGIIGMGPGQLSLVSHLEKRVFSYCLGSRFDPKASGVLLTGSEVSIQNGNVPNTSLVMDKSNYYISLEGISVGTTKLPVTKSDLPTSNGSPGGMIIDSGTTFTYLKQSIISMISNEFVKQTKLEKSDKKYFDGFDHCFHSPDDAIFPKLVFHFKGADWELPKENYLYEQKKGMACLAFIAGEESIFGNMQQQNMMVIYDLDKSKLSFYRPPTCNIL